MGVMNDFEIHKLCLYYKCLNDLKLSDDKILDSGKFRQLDKLLEEAKNAGDRVLLFSQFRIMLDITEDFMKLRKYRYSRLDGETKVEKRQR